MTSSMNPKEDSGNYAYSAQKCERFNGIRAKVKNFNESSEIQAYFSQLRKKYNLKRTTRHIITLVRGQEYIDKKITKYL